jgi:hypothetical protein
MWFAGKQGNHTGGESLRRVDWVSSALADRAAQVSSAAFGGPLEPEVNMTSPMSSSTRLVQHSGSAERLEFHLSAAGRKTLINNAKGVLTGDTLAQGDFQ